MKLINRKTNEMACFGDGIIDLRKLGCENVAEMIEAGWADYEGPKEYWYIEADGSIVQNDKPDFINHLLDGLKSVGNYFETKEEAEKAVEKLKAWKRLKDKGITIRKLQHNENGGTMYWSCPSKTGISDKQIWLDLDLLFGDEEL